jgi:hypothetical protein
MSIQRILQQQLPKYPRYYDLSEVQILFSKVQLDISDLSGDFVWIFSNFADLHKPCHREKIFDGMLFDNWFDYYNYHCRNKINTCLRINSMYHIIEVYDNEWCTVPLRYGVGLGPTNVEDAMFIRLFCPAWPQTPIIGNFEYHPKTNMLIRYEDLFQLVSNDTCEFVGDFKTTQLINNYVVLSKLTPLDQFIQHYKVLIESFAVFWMSRLRKEINELWLSDTWVSVLERHYVGSGSDMYYDPIADTFLCE